MMAYKCSTCGAEFTTAKAVLRHVKYDCPNRSR